MSGILGGAYNDTLSAGTTNGAFALQEGGGNDSLVGSSSGDIIHGGDGADTIVGGNTVTFFDGQDRTDGQARLADRSRSSRGSRFSSQSGGTSKPASTRP